MTRSIGGTKRSSWLTFRRRLLLVRCLLRGPTTRDDLIDMVRGEMHDHGYPPDAVSAIKHDISSLKNEYGCQIVSDRKTGCYALKDLGELALLDLPDECFEALAFLEASFPDGSAIPEHAHIRTLLDHILWLLPANRRQSQPGRKPIALTTHGSTNSLIDPDVFEVVKHAIDCRQELEFAYRSNTEDQRLITYRVAAYGIFVRPEGHGYVDTTILEVHPPTDVLRIHETIHFRLDRIQPGSARVLPTMLPPHRPPPRSYTLCYRLAPAIARRRDVASYFPQTKITYHDDGSATVVATITNLWETQHILLRYGDGCEILSPPELVAMVRRTVQGMVMIYCDGTKEGAEAIIAQAQ